MNLFFSGSHLAGGELDSRLPQGTTFRLLSCHGSYLNVAHTCSTELVSSGRAFEVMYDSGAFTAWSQGKEVDLEHLSSVYDDMLTAYGAAASEVWLISLDKIPGSKGRTASPAEINDAIEISDANFRILQKRFGDRVLPVFHQNESTSRLHEVAAMAPYVCISPRNDLGEKSRRAWSAEVHALIPGKRTHGLAATGYSMMTQVPWGSVDSATWVLLAANGSIFCDSKLRTLSISCDSGAVKDHDQHFRTLAPLVKEHFENEVTRRGFTIDGLETDFKERMLWNRVLMTEVYQRIPAADVVARGAPTEKGLFDL